MPKIVFSQLADVIADDPFDGEVIKDQATLSSLHGLYVEDSVLPNLDLDDLDEVIVGGGKLRLVYCPQSQSLRITTAFDVTRSLSTQEERALKKEIVEQWSDGAGTGSFTDHDREFASRTLAMALRNEYGDEVEIGDLFIDVAPMESTEPPRVEFFADGSSEDDFIADLERAIEQGDSSAMVVLGQRYLIGEGVEQNTELAFQMFQKSSQEKNPLGQILLGICLQKGDGCAADPRQAFELMSEAVASGLPFALHALGECYAMGQGVEQDQAKAVELFRRGADLGDPGCQAELGDCLEFGLGVDINLEEALNCYQEASAQGFDVVDEAIDRVRSKLKV